ncbi:S-adenosyl-L-methionine-dependent methyltransferases superfamily protein [Actinidia rufa]|uniref:S-adenosyl-L-methionine-dependent methyltransferases superfamily protein n=1 Tax=Actinidia rufa TaxID=165716 RepID=A0A7J0EEY8_9ERIC|nr:S-adenosyl-L-methionine-dependent methyltransferases superfamily protein [Actinidia rufa]
MASSLLNGAENLKHVGLISPPRVSFLGSDFHGSFFPNRWTEDMRDVGGGTGFTTLGIVKHVDAKNVTILDQSPHQLAKAKRKEALKECKIIEGDAEDLPFLNDCADRYISAGSIEYWPDPQRGIKEEYREEEYIEWFKKAGFKDVQLKTIGPKWYRGVRQHGLIMGCSVTGAKPLSGDSPLQLGPKTEDVEKPVNPFVFPLSLHSWCNCGNLLCAGPSLHVAQGSNYSKGYAYLKTK